MTILVRHELSLRIYLCEVIFQQLSLITQTNLSLAYVEASELYLFMCTYLMKVKIFQTRFFYRYNIVTNTVFTRLVDSFITAVKVRAHKIFSNFGKSQELLEEINLMTQVFGLDMG